MIRVVVTDPAARVRSALRMRLGLETDMSVVADCATLACARSAVDSGGVDVLVVDLVGDDAAHVSATAWLRAEDLACGVVVLSLDDRLVRLAGPRALFVSKYAGDSAVVDAVRLASGVAVPRPRTSSAAPSGLGPASRSVSDQRPRREGPQVPSAEPPHSLASEPEHAPDLQEHR